MQTEISKDFRFEAAHFLPFVDDNHKCKNIHGHSYLIRITLKGQINSMGWIMDLNEVSKICKPLVKMLDHKILNNIEGLENPTSENLACFIFNKLQEKMPQLYSVTIKATQSVEVTVYK